MVVVSRCLFIGAAVFASWVTACNNSSEGLFLAAESAAANPATRNRAIEQFQTFLSRYPQDPRCDEALRGLAMISRQQGRMEEAIGYYERLVADYPGSRFGVEAQFMVAFIYEEHLKDFDGARKAYELVIQNFPETELAASARRLLPHVGQDPEEWMQFKDVASTR